MEKKMISVHAITVHIYTIIIAVLVVVIAIIGLKYLHLKFAVDDFTQSTMVMNTTNQQPTGKVSDYGRVIATTITTVPPTAILLHDPANLENYVVAVSKALTRDVVVIDASRKVLADSIPANVGSNYAFDMNHEIDKVLTDGQERGFVEKSIDYPQGLTEVAVPVKTTTNQIIGVVLVSNTTVTH